jgi:hypothetical protein
MRQGGTPAGVSAPVEAGALTVRVATAKCGVFAALNGVRDHLIAAPVTYQVPFLKEPPPCRARLTQ